MNDHDARKYFQNENQNILLPCCSRFSFSKAVQSEAVQIDRVLYPNEMFILWLLNKRNYKHFILVNTR